MISFRTHVVTLVSVFLALAVGVVLGGGPLSEVGRGSDSSTEVAELRSVAAADARRADLGDRFAAEAAAPLYAGRLAEREVAVLTLPGADEDVVQSLGEQVGAAGGTVTVSQPLGETLLNPTEKSLVDTLGSQLADQLPEDTIAPDVPTYERIGQLVGLTVAVKDAEGDGSNAQTSSVLAGLTGAELLPEATPAERRAPLVLVVLGDEVEGDGGDDVLSGVLRGLAAVSVGVVVAGETAEDDDQLTRLREGEALAGVTSVDGVETQAGRVAAGLALIRGLQSSGGAFGASGADGALPLG